MDDEEHLKMFARAWILRFIGGVLLVDKSSKRVPMRYLQFLVAFEECSTYAWGAAALSYLYREMCNATDYNVQSIGVYVLLIQLWACEGCPKLVPSIVPPQQQNNPLGYRYTIFKLWSSFIILIIIVCNTLLFIVHNYYTDGYKIEILIWPAIVWNTVVLN